MARPTCTTIDFWTQAVNYGDKPPFAYLREKLPDFDGELRFFVYTAHERISDRLWCGSFRTSQQAVLWLEWHAVEMMTATAAEGEEARTLARALAELPSGFINRHIGRQAAR